MFQRSYHFGLRSVDFKVDVSVWDELIALITIRVGLINTQKCGVISIVNKE